MAQMDAKQAASLIEKWIAFYDMDNPQAWDRDDYTFVQQACRHMRTAIQTLRGKSTAGVAERRKLADGLEEFIEDSFMDDPHEWEPENRVFVGQAMEALQYTADQLRQSSTSADKHSPAGAQRHHKAAHGKAANSAKVNNKNGNGKGAINKPTTSKNAVTNNTTGKGAINKTTPSANATPKSGTSKGGTSKSIAGKGTASNRTATSSAAATNNNRNNHKSVPGQTNERTSAKGKGKYGGR